MISNHDDKVSKTVSSNRRWFSLKWKWSIGSAIIIFVILSIFSFLIYNRFSDVLLHQENSRTIESDVTISNRLRTINRSLDEKTVSSALNPNSGFRDGNPNNEMSTDVYSDSIYTNLFSKDIVVSVYNKNSDQIFSSKKSPKKIYNFKPVDSRKTVITKNSGKTILVLDSPIYSAKTHELIGYLRVVDSMSDYNLYINKLAGILFVILIIGIFFSAALSYFLSSYMLRPIKIISNTIHSVKESPETDSRVPKLTQNDELTDLGDLFNDMIDTMQRYIDQQQQFVEDVSHELRTPVAVIQGHLDMLSRWGKDDPEVLDESIKSSIYEINRMKSLVQEMLDLSRAEQVEINYGNKTTDVQDVVHQQYNDFQMIHPDYKFILDDDIGEETIIQIYRNHLEQILIILLDNAVKYSKQRKEIHISLSRKYRYVDIAVQDFGEGLSQESIDKIFNRFYRVDKARSRNQGGNGLGLSIAKRLVEAYNGKINVESSSGYGSIFTISFPILSKDKIEHLKQLDMNTKQ
ncbi:HAMP domain-containing sensor histidine kinase [Apilactobacillus kunkeei]|uniref:Signal transduction histidine-protein kinase ArlS n=1 Tax=Apilactobacillus kunkeei DSM 12361 = ATCC 700308 TaxID=1423768 RepID=A0A0R1FSJ5_9LACO|nr:HAMP domain-containing histidine kinase [Apilactobacillus kunkeei]KOY70060.1 Histidine protein kinase [Apilactobacillus kunkeei]KOY72931.1 Histidine protein kinase [Apilactobacillus kunkeei DSM 12361 = ATCC 700308]KPN82714.1 Histidine protein kinase sensor [Apilactobacillus kunkeei]KRK24815.1 histidine protein kinase [Apilactobacillus kunkeei DSM 12361 = ATCC 700308]MCK8625802.1 HAMP domain-containing histidine kinase [Apilactobacillus kunkeei]